jgi:hypothetical protein
MKHTWFKIDSGYQCEVCGMKRTFNPNIDYTGGNVPWPLTGYDRMELNESLYGECNKKKS